MLLRGPSGFPPVLFFVPLLGRCPFLSGVLLAIAPFTFCGRLAVAPSMGGACLAHLGILVPGYLVLGIVQGIFLVLSLFLEVFSSHG